MIVKMASFENKSIKTFNKSMNYMQLIEVVFSFYVPDKYKRHILVLDLREKNAIYIKYIHNLYKKNMDEKQALYILKHS